VSERQAQIPREGLSICRDIVEAHHGQLAVLPRSEGGAMFRFTLPLGSGEENRHAE
jgi:signal transduction histidine kinase